MVRDWSFRTLTAIPALLRKNILPGHLWEHAHNWYGKMTIAERLLELKHSGQPFVMHLSDGRALRIRAGDYISLNPSGKGTNVTVCGGGEDEELFIPIFAISSLSVEG